MDPTKRITQIMVESRLLEPPKNADIQNELPNRVARVFLHIDFVQYKKEGASTATSRGLTHLTNMTATCGLTSGFGMRPGRSRALWPAGLGFLLGVD